MLSQYLHWARLHWAFKSEHWVPSPCWVFITNLFPCVSTSSHHTSADPLYSYYQKHSLQGIVLQLNQSREPKGLHGNKKMVDWWFSSVWWMICSLLQRVCAMQCQSVKVAPKPRFILEKSQIRVNVLPSCKIKLRCQKAGLEMPVSFLWHCIDVIISAFSGKLVRWPFLSCFSKLCTESEWQVFCVISGHGGVG